MQIYEESRDVEYYKSIINLHTISKWNIKSTVGKHTLAQIPNWKKFLNSITTQTYWGTI